jgi:potassium efflux system protein
MIALSAEVRMLDQELLSQPMRIDLMKAERDTTERSLERIKARIKLLEELVAQKRRTDAEQARRDAEIAQAEMVGKHPLVQQLAEQNAELTDELGEVSARLEKLSAGDELAVSEAKRIEDEFQSTKQKLEIAGLSQALGRVLLEQRRLLPDIRAIRKQAKAREGLIADAALNQIQHTEEYKQLRHIPAFVEQLTTELPPEQADGIRQDLEDLAQQRGKLLEKALSLDETYLRALGELDYAQNQLINAIAAYDALLAERLLWIRSAPPPNLAMLLEMPVQFYQLLSPSHWLGAVEILIIRFTTSPFPALVLMAFAVLLFKSARIREALLNTGKLIIKPRSDRFRYTLQAVGLTLLLAAPWPLLLATAGWQLATSLEATAFSKALARALILLSPAFYYLMAFRVMCLPGGLAEAHFRWPGSGCQALRRQFGILMITFLPTVFVAVLTIYYSSTGDTGGLGRLAFVLIMLSLSYFFYRLFGPRQTSLAGFTTRHPSSALARFQYLWLALALVLPATLAGLALVGYLYTASTLTGSLIDTLWLILGFIVIHQLAVRWLLVARRKLAFEAALERRRAALAAEQQAAEEQSSQPGGDEGIQHEEEPEIDLVALNEESQKLLNTLIPFTAVIGLWFIWSDVLPAFGLLDKIELWHHSSVVAGETQLVPTTLADILLAVLIGIVAFVATRRFPALLEIILLQRFSVSSGARYAAITLSQYSIAAAGTLFALNTIGASWSQVQWLAAALSVGIGFGLQEIVANFISGIILLFERPIRVGDVVTVGDTDGTVSRIQIRATTIRNWDRQELLVPNKEFITGRLLNWSLSDETTRIKIPVGVAYGSDVQKAMSLMDEAARENDKVLEEPPPSIVFDCFGDNSLNLVLRCFVGTQEARMQTITKLHEAINRKFNDAGLVISFPQRDVHLDTSQPLDIRIRHDDGGKSPG